MYYTKICPICSKSFTCIKISTIFCSKKCNNRTRYLPKHLVEAIVKRNSQYSMTANNYTAIVRNEAGVMDTVGFVPEGATKDNPLGKDAGLLLAIAKVRKENLDNELREKKIEEEKRYPVNKKTGTYLIAKEPEHQDVPDTIDSKTGFNLGERYEPMDNVPLDKEMAEMALPDDVDDINNDNNQEVIPQEYKPKKFGQNGQNGQKNEKRR